MGRMSHLRTAVLVVAMAWLAAACANMPGFSRTNAQAGQAPAGAQATEKSISVYYDFDDIAVPADFKLVKDHSFVYQSGPLKNGLLVFDGRVEPVSAANFMVASMAKDNWRLKSSFKYGRTLMLFEKPGKTALVMITEGITNTRLEVWVAPLPETSLTQPAGGRQVLGPPSELPLHD